MELFTLLTHPTLLDPLALLVLMKYLTFLALLDLLAPQ